METSNSQAPTPEGTDAGASPLCATPTKKENADRRAWYGRVHNSWSVDMVEAQIEREIIHASTS